MRALATTVDTVGAELAQLESRTGTAVVARLIRRPYARVAAQGGMVGGAGTHSAVGAVGAHCALIPQSAAQSDAVIARSVVVEVARVRADAEQPLVAVVAIGAVWAIAVRGAGAAVVAARIGSECTRIVTEALARVELHVVEASRQQGLGRERRRRRDEAVDEVARLARGLAVEPPAAQRIDSPALALGGYEGWARLGRRQLAAGPCSRGNLCRTHTERTTTAGRRRRRCHRLQTRRC